MLIIAILHVQDDSNTSVDIKECFYWRYTVGSRVVQFENVPFSVGEKRIMDCQHGTLL